MKNLILAVTSFCSSILAPIANLWARIYMGLIFDPEEDGDFIISFLPESIPPEIPAYMATIGELVLPAMLFVGLFTRFGALGLLIMTIVIQFFVDGFSFDFHYLWMIIFAMLVAYGGDKLSLDYLLGRKLKR